MSTERTFGIVKPDAVGKNAVGGVIDMIERGGLKLVGLRQVRLSEAQARAFYAVHKERPFYNDLVKFMTSGPVVVMAIEGENAIARTYSEEEVEVLQTIAMVTAEMMAQLLERFDEATRSARTLPDWICGSVIQ